MHRLDIVARERTADGACPGRSLDAPGIPT
jgi:hypothetical protein